jgi:hypothetical protein
MRETEYAIFLRSRLCFVRTLRGNLVGLGVGDAPPPFLSLIGTALQHADASLLCCHRLKSVLCRLFHG